MPEVRLRPATVLQAGSAGTGRRPGTPGPPGWLWAHGPGRHRPHPRPCRARRHRRRPAARDPATARPGGRAGVNARPTPGPEGPPSNAGPPRPPPDDEDLVGRALREARIDAGAAA